MKKIFFLNILLFCFINFSFSQTDTITCVWKDWKNDDEHDGHSRYYVIIEDIIYISESLYDDGIMFPKDLFFSDFILMDKNTIEIGYHGTILYKIKNNKFTKKDIIGCFSNGGKNSITFDEKNHFIIEEHYFNDSLTDVNITEGSYSFHDNFIILMVSNSVYLFYIIDNKNIMCIFGPYRFLLKLFNNMGKEYYKLIK